MKISYNAPFTLTLTLLCVIVRLMGDNVTTLFFAVGNDFFFSSPVHYFRLFSHTLGHADWGHLVSNFSLILILGPILEEKYGAKSLIKMSIITAFVTGVINVMFLKTGLYGASGLVFMMIMLASFANFKSGTIPLTFILVLVFYVGNEVFQAFQKDNISHFAHILGGFTGSIFGFGGAKNNQS
jgi:membrane associated rhomboid family serine protease